MNGAPLARFQGLEGVKQVGLTERYRVLGMWIKVVAILLPLVAYIGATCVLARTRPHVEWPRHVETPEESGSVH